MLSEENRKKICATGVYQHDINLKWLPEMLQDNPFHCHNWTFTPVLKGSKVYMIDTYWGDDNFCIELTDDNFHEFEFLFDQNDVRQVNEIDFYDYRQEDKWHVALDSGGWRYNKFYLVRKDAIKDKKLMLERLHGELIALKYKVQQKESEIAQLENT